MELILLLIYFCLSAGFGFSFTLYLCGENKNIVELIVAWILFSLLFPALFGVALGIWSYKMGYVKVKTKTD